MAGLVEKVVSSVIMLVVNKCTDEATEKLKEGGLTRKKIGDLIERETHMVAAKLNGIASTDLKTALDSFELAVRFLWDAIDPKSSEDTSDALEPARNPFLAAGVNEDSLVDGMTNIDLTDLDENAEKAIVNAKERFKMARKKATSASNCEALDDSLRITAIRYRVMAAILEKFDNPADALTECKYCLEKLHSLSEVHHSFKAEIKGEKLHREERRQTISTVCRINHAVYNVTQSTGMEDHLLSWPSVNTGDDKVDPLRDARVTRILHKHGMEHCCVTPWSFGQEGEQEQKLKLPCGITSDAHRNFILADNKESNVKVFNKQGKFQHAFHIPSVNDYGLIITKVQVYDVTTDIDGNIYVLFGCEKPGAQTLAYGIFVKSVAGRHQEFYLKEDLIPWSWYLPSLAVTDNNKVLVRGSYGRRTPVHVVDVYNTDGQFVHRFGEQKLKKPSAMAAANGDTVVVLDLSNSQLCVRSFNAESGNQLLKFKVDRLLSSPVIAFHKKTKHVIIAGIDTEKHHLCLLEYTEDGRTFVRSTELNLERLDCLRAMTVTLKGHIGMTVGFLRKQSKNPDNNSFVTPVDSFLDAEHDYKVVIV